QRLNLKVEKDKDGIYSLTLENPPVPIYFRFANNHAYVTILNQGALAKDKLLDPAKVLPDLKNSVLSLRVGIDKIPKNLKEDAIAQLELALANAKEQAGGDTEAQKKLAGAAIDEVSRLLVSVLKDGGDLALDLNIDRKNNNLAIDLSLTGKPQSQLASNIAEWG